jgi:hypothetical protein
MGQYEIIDRLCEVTTLLSEIVRKQAEAIAQSDISVEVKNDLEKMRTDADERLDVIEYRLRKFR